MSRVTLYLIGELTVFMLIALFPISLPPSAPVPGVAPRSSRPFF